MANLKLIRVTGKPFSDVCKGHIGIQTGSESFQIIKDGRTFTQHASSGEGYELATKTEIQICWSTIYPHWTPEPGDKVIITQDYGIWANSKATIVEKDADAENYYKVEREDGCKAVFNYTSQMILAPYSETIVKPAEKLEQYHLHGFKLGDRVESTEISGPTLGKKGTVVHFNQGHVGVSFDEDIGGHNCNDHCPYGRGRYLQVTQVRHYIEPKEPKEETVSIRFLREQEFRDKGLWGNYAPQGWHSGGEMNKYLGQSVVIPKSSIGSDGSFVYQYWSFKVTDYIVTEWIPSKVDDFRDVSKTIASSSVPVGSSQPVTRLIIKGNSAAGDANGVFVGGKFYPISSSSSVHPIPPTCGTYSTIATINPDPLSLYEQKPITIKPKPKTKLTTI